MPLEHVNRRGDRYYIYEGKTKTGKPKYFASKRATSEKGVPVETLPEDFEVSERPDNASVSVRRRKPTRVLPGERELVDRLAVELSACSCAQTIVDGNRIVIYTPDTDPVASEAVFASIFGSSPPGSADWTARITNYSAALRFTLKDVDQRIYIAERFCYRGAIDGWTWIGGPAPLEPLARELVPHLGKESFFELY